MYLQTRWFRFLVLFYVQFRFILELNQWSHQRAWFVSNTNNEKIKLYTSEVFDDWCRNMKMQSYQSEHGIEVTRYTRDAIHSVHILFIGKFVSCKIYGKVSRIEWNFFMKYKLKMSNRSFYLRTIFNWNQTMNRVIMLILGCTRKTLDSHNRR